MTCAQIEMLVLNHYGLWLAFTAERKITEQARWIETNNACRALQKAAKK